MVFEMFRKIFCFNNKINSNPYLDEQFKQHQEGKKHKKLESIKLDREKTASRSLFVSGLKKGTFLKSLEEHFEKFGKITKIVIDQEKVDPTLPVSQNI